jgi:hypothetical protein
MYIMIYERDMGIEGRALAVIAINVIKAGI